MDKELEDKILNQLSDDDRNLIHEQYVRRVLNSANPMQTITEAIQKTQATWHTAHLGAYFRLEAIMQRELFPDEYHPGKPE